VEKNAWLTGIDKPFVDEGTSGAEIAEGAIFSETYQHRILNCLFSLTRLFKTARDLVPEWAGGWLSIRVSSLIAIVGYCGVTRPN
jgi:hypothetical protein